MCIRTCQWAKIDLGWGKQRNSQACVAIADSVMNQNANSFCYEHVIIICIHAEFFGVGPYRTYWIFFRNQSSSASQSIVFHFLSYIGQVYSLFISAWLLLSKYLQSTIVLSLASKKNIFSKLNDPMDKFPLSLLWLVVGTIVEGWQTMEGGFRYMFISP